MNISEANATFVVLKALYGIERTTPRPTEEQIRSAAELLAERAHKALAAGPSPRDFADAPLQLVRRAIG